MKVLELSGKTLGAVFTGAFVAGCVIITAQKTGKVVKKLFSKN